MSTHHTATEHLAIDFGIVIHAWGTLRQALRALPGRFASSVALTALLTWAAWRMQGPFHTWLSAAPAPFGDMVDFFYTLIVTALDSLVLAATAIPVHRMVLLGETRDGVLALFSGRTLRFAFWLIAVQMCGFLALLPLPLLFTATPAGRTAIVAGMAAFLVGLFVAAVRLSLALPAIAIDHPARGVFRRAVTSWSLSRGHFWRLIITAVFAMVPLLFLILLATLAGSAVIGLTGPMVSMMDMLMWFEVAVTALSRPLGAALAAGVLSWNYKLARDELERA